MFSKRYKRYFIKLIRFSYREFRYFLFRFYSLYRKTVTINTRNGIYTIQVLPSCPISCSLFLNGHFCEDQINNTLLFLRETSRIPEKGTGIMLDIGANNGITTISMLTKNEFSRSIAIEADPENYDLLVRNVDQNNMRKRVTCHQYAASNTKSLVELGLSAENLGDHRILGSTNTVIPEIDNESSRKTVSVNSDTLDNLITGSEDKISLIWIDIQGHEGHAFRGAKNLLKRNIPVVSEVWPYGIRRSGISDKEYFEIIESYWSYYWVQRKNSFVRYPIDTMPILFEELGDGLDYNDVIFTKD